MRRPAALAALALSLAIAGCGGTSGDGEPTAAPATNAPASSPTTASTTAEPVEPAAGRVPQGFMGMVSEDTLQAGRKDRADLLAGQKRTGVELLRQTFDWSQIEKRRGRYDFSHYDAYLTQTAQAGIDVLAVIFRSPAFRAAEPAPGARTTATTTMPPRSPDEMAAFARVLVRRYGPGGTFWRAHPDLPERPIRAWQIWNEPNLPVYWGGRVDAGAYVRLLRAVGGAIRKVDPKADVVAAGVTESRLGVPLGDYIRQMYAAGARGTFTTLGLHPYATTPAGVVAAVKLARRLADRAGDRRAGVWVTEVGWASDGPPSAFTVGPRRQARNVLVTFTTLARQAADLRLRGVVYYNWRDAVPYPGGRDFWGLHAGLLKLNGDGKEALSTYYQAAGVVDKLQRRVSR